MPDAIFDDPRLARVYDPLDPAEAEAGWQAALGRWQEAVAGQAETALKRARDLQSAAPPDSFIVQSNGASTWTDPAVNATLEDREEAERRVSRTRPAVAAAEAAARARWQQGKR